VTDATNADWQRDVANALEKQGKIKLNLDDKQGTLAAYQEAVDIRKRLVAANRSGKAEPLHHHRVDGRRQARHGRRTGRPCHL
jgi:hypothetical protein